MVSVIGGGYSLSFNVLNKHFVGTRFHPIVPIVVHATIVFVIRPQICWAGLCLQPIEPASVCKELIIQESIPDSMIQIDR